MMVCPSCQKPTALNFMWHTSATERMCLVCHHRMETEKQKAVECSGARLVSGGNGRGTLFLKLGGMLAGGLAVLVGLLWLFYKPHPLVPPPLPPMTEEQKFAARAGKFRREAAKARLAAAEEAAANADPSKKDGKPGAKKRDPKSLTVSGVGDGTSGKTERVAPKVEALISQLPTGEKKSDPSEQIKGKSAIATLVAKAEEIRDSLAGKSGSDAQAGPALKPKQDVKEKLLSAKDSVLKFASAVIDKKDTDGTKTVNALGKLGAVSTVLADVTAKLVPLGPGASEEKKPDENSGNGNKATTSATAPPKLEADILEAQGRAGYDAMDAMLKEAAAAEAGAKGSLTVKTALDPNGNKLAPDLSPDARLKALVTGALKVAPGPKGTGPSQQAIAPGGKPGLTNAKPPTLGTAFAGLKTAPAKQTQLNSTEIKLNDTTIRLNALGNPTGVKVLATTGMPLPEPKLNDTAIRLHDTAITLHSTAVQLKKNAGKLNDLTVALRRAAAGTKDSTLGASVAAMSLHTLVVRLGAESASEDAESFSERAVTEPDEPAVLRKKSVLKSPGAPPEFLATLGIRPRAADGKKGAAPRVSEIPVLVLTIRSDRIFRWDSAEIRTGATLALREVATVLICRANLPVIVRASGDGADDPAEDAAFGLQRADAVRNWLVAYGCIPARNTSVGASVPEEPAPQGKKGRSAAPAPVAAKERSVTITIPLVSEFAGGTASR
jgi:outer membrane protein OmpA-like peptidoglycan-associated protein